MRHGGRRTHPDQLCEPCSRDRTVEPRRFRAQSHAADRAGRPLSGDLCGQGQPQLRPRLCGPPVFPIEAAPRPRYGCARSRRSGVGSALSARPQVRYRTDIPARAAGKAVAKVARGDTHIIDITPGIYDGARVPRGEGEAPRRHWGDAILRLSPVPRWARPGSTLRASPRSARRSCGSAGSMSRLCGG
jgi:hypothetical protein